MVKVFIGGSRSLMRLPSAVASRVDNIAVSNFTVLVGDAIGADICVQQYLAEKNYANVQVFCTGVCRNNAGAWKTMVISANAKEKGFDFYALKDQEMARAADYGFMVWDGKSKGTLNNILNLLSEHKNVLVFFSPDDSFHTIRDHTDLSKLLAKCDRRALEIFEEKLGLSKRLKGAHASLQPARISFRTDSIPGDPFGAALYPVERPRLSSTSTSCYGDNDDDDERYREIDGDDRDSDECHFPGECLMPGWHLRSECFNIQMAEDLAEEAQNAII
ncbi:MAG: hypothetical protein MOB07_20880 [Acidobacteria bacterium]|nr:hypothetical protein [Acidobacteriota bacterium]